MMSVILAARFVSGSARCVSGAARARCPGPSLRRRDVGKGPVRVP